MHSAALLNSEFLLFTPGDKSTNISWMFSIQVQCWRVQDKEKEVQEKQGAKEAMLI